MWSWHWFSQMKPQAFTSTLICGSSSSNKGNECIAQIQGGSWEFYTLQRNLVSAMYLWSKCTMAATAKCTFCSAFTERGWQRYCTITQFTTRQKTNIYIHCKFYTNQNLSYYSTHNYSNRGLELYSYSNFVAPNQTILSQQIIQYATAAHKTESLEIILLQEDTKSNIFASIC